MLRQEVMLRDMTAASGRFTCLECYLFVLARPCLGWLCGGASFAALAAWVSGVSCMTLAVPLGSGICKGWPLAFPLTRMIAIS